MITRTNSGCKGGRCSIDRLLVSRCRRRCWNRSRSRGPRNQPPLATSPAVPLSLSSSSSLPPVIMSFDSLLCPFELLTVDGAHNMFLASSMLVGSGMLTVGSLSLPLKVLLNLLFCSLHIVVFNGTLFLIHHNLIPWRREPSKVNTFVVVSFQCIYSLYSLVF